MRVKEVERTANVAWSPAAQYPVYLAAGTAAQQLDATFSTSAALEIYNLDLSEPGLEMKIAGSIPSDNRFHKLVWGEQGMSKEHANGVLVGGADNGKIFLWDPAKLIEKEDCLIETLDKHVGAVSALDFNNFQTNLLASGASDSEIYIWDLNNTANPMTPGAKSQPPDDVTCVSWNKSVQHILASAYCGRCVVWDLRKNDPIIKVSDSMSRIKCKHVAWHPEVATQLCLASEDDHTPVIQLWDLRFATSPLKCLESHQRGILSIAWCPQDPDLLLSCGKDNRILCWNPNSNVQTGEVVYELPTSNQWSFDVQWCPRNPSVISSCSFDGHVGVYSLMGGSKPVQNTTSMISDSFPTDPFAQTPQQPTQREDKPVVALKKAPKWLRRPVGASFAFGGKLITFENAKPQHPQQPPQRLVYTSQVVTETDLVARSHQLETALTNGQYSEFCAMKIANCQDEQEEHVWNFLKVHFEKDPRSRYLQLLGYDQTDLARKVAENTGADIGTLPLDNGVDATELAQKMAMLNATPQSAIPSYLAANSGQVSPILDKSQTPQDTGSAPSEGASAFDNIATKEEGEDYESDSPLDIDVSDSSADGLITQALLTANFEASVEVCLHNNRMAEAIILAIAGGPELLARTQKKFFQKNKNNLGRLIASVVTRDFEHIIRTCDLENWREALAVAITYAKAEEFSNLCDILGSRLESEAHGKFAANACLCYICAGNVERLVYCWAKITKDSRNPESLQDLVEKVMVLRKAVETIQGRSQEVTSGILAEKLSNYAELLAGQGSLTTAINYLGDSQEARLAVMRDRLYKALGHSTGTGQGPFSVMNVLPESSKATQQQQQQQQRQQQQQHSSSVPQSQFGNTSSQQAQAGRFQTTTTPSSTYYSGPQYTQGTPSGPPSYNPTSSGYMPGQPPVSSAPSAVSKAQKYPSYPQASTGYEQYGQQDMYANPPQTGYDPTSYGSYGNQPQTSAAPPSIFNPTVNSAVPDESIHTRDTESRAAACEPAPMKRRQSQISFETEKGAPVPPSSSQPSMPSYQESRPNQAWNDPPSVARKRKEQTPAVSQAPITQPIYGVPQPEQTPPGAPNYGAQIYNPQQYQPQSYQGTPQQQYQGAPQQQSQQVARPAVKKAEPPKPKGPIPDEHKVLQDVLDGLAKQCLARAGNPQVKRKLEDVLRKLELLYDKLRENALSPNVTQGLHQIVQAIQAFDYQNGLAYHTHLITQGNFSEISSFMPGIKALMQTAQQMQQYVGQ